jgi:hypothetical protein
MTILRTRAPREALMWLTAAASLVYACFIARSAFPAGGRLGFTLFDDAMISMRFARNLAEGYGLVWNPGDRVEGFTNPLWTLWMAAIHLAGVSDEHASLVVMVSGALLLLATAAVAARIAERAFQSSEVAVATFALVAFNYALVFWTLRGMEVGLLALLMTLALGLTLSVEASAEANLPPEGGSHRRDIKPHRRDITRGFRLQAEVAPYLAPLFWLCLVLALGETTRRDAAVIHLTVMAYLAWSMTGHARIVVLAALAATMVAALGAQLAFSAWYYGDPWPNTYYLKLEGVTLLDRLRRGVPALLIVVVRNLLPLVIAALFLLGRPRWLTVRRPLVLFAAVIGVQAAYSAYVGGDAWEFMGYTNRYLTTVVPVLSILAAAGIRELSRAGGDLKTRFVSLLLATIGLRLLLEAALHVANRGVARGTTWFELHRTGWLTVILSVACVLLGLAVALAFRSRPAARGTGSPRWHAPAFAVLAVWAVANGAAFFEWAAENASSMSNDIRGAQTGLMVRRLTASETVIAVTSAGNVPYFSRRRAIDILGKSDPVIAHMAPVNSFVPGHNKWNLDHSIRDGRPDLVWGLPRATGEVSYLVRLGYQSYPGMCFAKRDSAHVDHAALWRELAVLYPDAPPYPDHANAAGIE